MLKASIDAFLALRRAVGFQLKTEEYLLHRFAEWASDRGETHVRTITATAWAASAPTPWERERRLQVVARFARHVRTEDARHEIPPIYVFARSQVRSRRYIYSREELQSLMTAATRLAPIWSLRAEVFSTLFGLLASTGLRISEALALRLTDVTDDGLIIRKTKFNKSRLVPLHPTASSALERYLAIRRRVNNVSDYIFVSPTGNKLPYTTVSNTFGRLVRQTGIGSSPKSPSPCIHSFRHTFAVSVLETCPAAESAVGRHLRALSTYLGHAKLSHTSWYLQATPRLMRGVADACQQFFEGGGQ